MVEYPTNMIDRNVVRFQTPDNISTENRLIKVINTPADFWYLVMGAMTYLGDVNAWKKSGTTTEQESVDLWYNEVEFMDLCEVVYQCVSSNPSAYAAIFNGSQTNVNNWDTPTRTVDDVIALDCLYGGCLYWSQYLYDLLDHTITLLETTADFADSLSDALGDAKIFGTPVALISEFLTGMISFGVALIRADLTIDKPLEWACELFNIIRCAQIAPYSFTTNDIEAFYNQLSMLNGADVGLATMMYPFGTSAQGSGISRDKQFIMFVLGLDDCSPDWQIACSSCPGPWCKNYDFRVSAYGWDVFGGNGLGRTTKGWLSKATTSGPYRPCLNYIRIDTAAPFNTDYLQITVDTSNDSTMTFQDFGYVAGGIIRSGAAVETFREYVGLYDISPGATFTYNFAMEDDCEGYWIGCNPGLDTGSWYIRSVRVMGDGGTAPPGGTTC